MESEKIFCNAISPIRPNGFIDMQNRAVTNLCLW